MSKNIEHKFINLDARDYHMHTSTFSDGLNTIEEIVQFAWKIGLTEVAITDHSQACLEMFMKHHKFYRAWARWTLPHWKNVHNDVNVIFWVEWDLLNESGDVSFDIQWIEGDFLILSAHSDIYQWDPQTVTEGTIKAIERYHEKIRFIGHPCNNADFWKYYDIERLVECANTYKIPLEFNAKNLLLGKTNIDKLHILFEKADRLYLNSDAHTLYQLREARPFALQFLKDNNYIA